MKHILAILFLASLFAAACGAESTSSARPARSFERWERWSGATVPTPSTLPDQAISALWDTYYLPAALELIDGATEEIEVVHFLFAYGPSVRQIQDALARAVRRGVRVRALIDDEPGGNASALPHLERRGIEARLDNARTRTHVKLILADRRRALFGSTNLSDNSINNNHETNLLVEDGEIGAALGRYADELWRYADELWRDATPSVAIDPVVIEGLELHVDRSFEPALIALIDGARARIDLQMYATRIYVDDPASPSTRAFDALRRAARRGVTVRVLLDRGKDDEWGSVLNELNAETIRFLREADVEVRVDPLEVISHAKLLLVDDAATVGSMNWGFGGFRLHHELNTIVTDPVAVGDFRDYFETLWSRGEP